MKTSDGLARVLGSTVRVADSRVGQVTGVLGDPAFERVIGLEVTGQDGSRKFLPWVAATFRDGSIDAGTRLVLLDGGEIESYATHGATIVYDDAVLGPLTVTADGRITRRSGTNGVSVPSLEGSPVR